MNGLAILIPLALIMGGIGLVAFFWALKRGSSRIWTALQHGS